MDRDYDIEYQPNPDDERDVLLDEEEPSPPPQTARKIEDGVERDVPLDEDEPSPPPTLDPEERVEEIDDDLVEDDERPV